MTALPLPPDVGEALADYIRFDRVHDIARALRDANGRPIGRSRTARCST